MAAQQRVVVALDMVRRNAVFRSIARHNGVRLHLRAVVEREGEDVRQPGTRCQVAEDRVHRTAPPSTVRRRRVHRDPPPTTAASGTASRCRRSAPGGIAACCRRVGLGDVGEPGRVVARESERAHPWKRRLLPVRQTDDDERLPIRRRRTASSTGAFDFHLVGLGADITKRLSDVICAGVALV